MKTTREYIEYCEEEVEMEIKTQNGDMESSQKRQNIEYFEEDVKEEIIDEKKPETNLMRHTCGICNKNYKSKGRLAIHTQSIHSGLKYQS